MGILQSAMFAGDTKLENCAVNDIDHIGESYSPNHPSVVKIQMALETVTNIDLSRERGHFGPMTGDVVEMFKRDQKPPIVNQYGKIDRIVGKKTIRILDGLLPKGSPSPAPVMPTSPGPPLDIFVYFRGAPPEQQGQLDTLVTEGFKKAFNTEAYLKTHQPAVPICFFGGRGATDKSSEVAATVAALRKETPEGVTIVRGDSIGGLTALKAAQKLNQKGVRLTYVAIDDAAFFASDGDIKSFDPLKLNVPPVVADRKENFFQTFGHELLVKSGGAGGFMDGAEFHGPLDGFVNKDVRTGSNTSQVVFAWSVIPGSFVPSAFPLRVRLPFANQAHEAAHKDADPAIDAVVKTLIKP